MRDSEGTPRVAIAWLSSARSSREVRDHADPVLDVEGRDCREIGGGEAAPDEVAGGAARALEARQVGERLVEEQQEAPARRRGDAQLGDLVRIGRVHVAKRDDLGRPAVLLDLEVGGGQSRAPPCRPCRSRTPASARATRRNGTRASPPAAACPARAARRRGRARRTTRARIDASSRHPRWKERLIEPQATLPSKGRDRSACVVREPAGTRTPRWLWVKGPGAFQWIRSEILKLVRSGWIKRLTPGRTPAQHSHCLQMFTEHSRCSIGWHMGC